MPTSYKTIKGFFNVRYENREWWQRVKSKAAARGISINDLILALLDKWLDEE